MHWCAPQPSSAHPCPLAPSQGWVSQSQRTTSGLWSCQSDAKVCWGNHRGRKKGQGPGGGGGGRRSWVRQAQPCGAVGRGGGKARGGGAGGWGGGAGRSWGCQAPPTARRVRGHGVAARGCGLAGRMLVWLAMMRLQKACKSGNRLKALYGRAWHAEPRSAAHGCGFLMISLILRTTYNAHGCCLSHPQGG